MNIRQRRTEGQCRHPARRTVQAAETDSAQAREPAHKQTHEPERSTSAYKEAEP
jgi:hypothetical protein